MDILLIGVLFGLLIWAGVFAWTCHSLMQWRFADWGRALKMAFEHPIDNWMYIHGGIFILMGIILAICLWAIGILPH